jgi:hypothetical protein
MIGHVHSVGREALGLIPFTHFGVEVPGGVCQNSMLGGVHLVPWEDFARGRATQVRNYDATPEQLAETARRALSRVGENRYVLLWNNCEHFANWCATGLAISYQVIVAIGMFLRMLLAAALGMAVVSFAPLVGPSAN